MKTFACFFRDIGGCEINTVSLRTEAKDLSHAMQKFAAMVPDTEEEVSVEIWEVAK